MSAILVRIFSIALCYFLSPWGLAVPNQIMPLGPDGLIPIDIEINAEGCVLLASSPRDNLGGPIASLNYIDGTAIEDLSGLFSGIAALNDLGQVLGTNDEAGSTSLRLWSADEGVADIRSTILPGPAMRQFNASGHYLTAINENDVWRTMIASIHDETLTDIGSLGGQTIGQMLSNEGFVAGLADTGASLAERQAGAIGTEAFLFADTIEGLGTFFGPNSIAFGVNNNGLVVGDSTAEDGFKHAFLFDPSVGLIDIGPFGRHSVGRAINDSALVVGSEILDDGEFQAFLYSTELGNVPLVSLVSTDSGWSHLSHGVDINNAGQIVGIGVYQGHVRAFLMSPIPEPRADIILLLICTVILGVSKCIRPPTDVAGDDRR